MGETSCGSVVMMFLISFLCLIATLKTVSVHGLPLSTSNQEYGNNIQLPLRQNLSKIQNDSGLHINITSNELSTEAIYTSTVSTHLIKTPTTNLPLTHTIGDMLGGFESKSTDFPNVATTVTNLLGTKKTTLPILTENYTTASPSASTVVHNHHFNMKILDYILIPVGCLLAIVVLYCVVRQVQKMRRKRRLERELLHQYSYPNSEADDLEEQNIGDLESIVNTQFVAFSDRSDKSLYEDSPEVNLAFGESSKLVVQEPTPPSPPEELQVATSFNS